MSRSQAAPAPRWYALSVHARQERAAEAALVERGFEIWLPTRIERRMWSDRIKAVEQALFPGYLFVRTALDAERRVEMLKVRQVWDLVGRLPGDRRIAQAIPDHEIESLRTVVGADRALDPVSGLVAGIEVVVGQGALRGARGVVVEAPDGRRRLTVQIGILGRGVRVVLEADDVLAAEPEAGGVD
jgi:transcription antitermination factor NusG